MKTIVQLLLVLAFVYAIFGMFLFENYSKSNIEGLAYQGRFQHVAISAFTLFQLLTYDHWFVMLEGIFRFDFSFFVFCFFFSFRKLFFNTILQRLNK